MTEPIALPSIARQIRELREKFDRDLAALRREFELELERSVDELTARIDSVHTAALRELTRRTEARR